MAKATPEQVAMAMIALDLGRLLRMAEAHRLGLLAWRSRKPSSSAA